MTCMHAFVPSSLNTRLLQLQRQGIEGNEEGETLDDPELLMEVMEARERLAECESAQELQDMHHDLQQQERACLQVNILSDAPCIQ